MFKKNIVFFKDWLASRRWTTVTFSLLVTAYFVIAFNQPFIAAVASAHGISKPADYLFMITAIIVLMALVNFVVSILAFKYTFKVWLVFLCIASASVSYFMETYHVLVDNLMIQNTFETDAHEVIGLLSWKLAFDLTIFGIIPSLIIIKTPMRHDSLLRECIKKGIIFVASLATIILIALAFYQDYATLLRNNKHLRDLVVPDGYLYGTYKYARSQFTTKTGITHKLGEDAHLGDTWRKNNKKVVAIIVVGETARAENFYLSGYARDTNPNLKRQDIVYYNDFHSCGTATATSVPCMFSNLGRKNFSESTAKHRENLLDIIHRAGLSVLWRDNNSGCKGVCDRVDYDDVSHLGRDDLCNSEECFDMTLLHQLHEKIQGYQTRGVVVVLHQKGSHGPDYYRRVPDEFQQFQPVCQTNRMTECPPANIINAYDNTILYTDYVLSNMIDFLKAHTSEYDASLFYVSDHGESLGENNLYLHGMPYSIAPTQQTHVPALFWLSDGFAKRFNINKQCLIQHESDNYSQDNLFHSTLGLLDINTQDYDANLDMYKVCRSAP